MYQGSVGRGKYYNVSGDRVIDRFFEPVRLVLLVIVAYITCVLFGCVYFCSVGILFPLFRKG